jgi:hypothetical protein
MDNSQILKPLLTIDCNKTKLNCMSIDSFSGKCSRSANDATNKIRENIICTIINDEIPDEFYNYSDKWGSMRRYINNYIKLIIPKNDVINTMECTHKGGRKCNSDFIFTINEIKYNVEFKFNTTNIYNIPQVVSLMKPSKYLYNKLYKTYETFYYDKYLPELFQIYNLTIPQIDNLTIPKKDLYLREVHNIRPNCMIELRAKYYKGSKGSTQFSGNKDDIQFYNKCKELSKNSIREFIKIADLNIKKLTDYLKKTQPDKHYMLYENGEFYHEKVNMDKYELISFVKEPNKSRFIATSISGNEIKILLRWKNGNGIAYPAFQISHVKVKNR